MGKKCLLIIALIAIFWLVTAMITACTVPGPNTSPLPTTSPLVQLEEGDIQPLNVPAKAPLPAVGKASVSGVLYSCNLLKVIPETSFYLVFVPEDSNLEPPVVLPGPRPELGDIRGVSDDRGRITLNDVPPGRYYLAVWAPYNWILAVESPTNLTPRVIVLEPNQRKVLGIIYVPWP